MNGGAAPELVVDNMLNCRGLRCPLPVIYTRKALEKMEIGQIIHVIATDPDSVEDMKEFSKLSGHELVASSEESGDFNFYLRKAQ